jgi:hypothetical protein
MALDEQARSPEARARAERALIWLLHGVADDALDLIVLGGLVPQTLADALSGDTPAHLGTTDVDVLLITHLDATAGLASVEAALGRMDFAPFGLEPWRWRGTVDGTGVRMEFLCDLADYRAERLVRPPGCRRLAALNLRGTRYVALDFESRPLTGTLPDGQEITVMAKFAALQGYLLSKCVAARTRGEPKDFYDLAYVLLHNREGGPRGAAELLLAGPLSDAVASLRSTFLEVRERYRTTGDLGPNGYAEQMLDVVPEADEATLRADAVVAAQDFFDRLLGTAQPSYRTAM